MKVLNFGSLNVDYVYQVDHIMLPGETQSSTQRNVFAGGKGLNQSVALAKAGLPTYHAGQVGNDADGEMLLQVLFPGQSDRRAMRPHFYSGGQRCAELYPAFWRRQSLHRCCLPERGVFPFFRRRCDRAAE